MEALGSPNRAWAWSSMFDMAPAEPDWAAALRLACCRNWSTERVMAPTFTPPVKSDPATGVWLTTSRA